MGATARYGLQYLDRGEPMRNTRVKLQANAESTETVLTRLQAYVNQLASLVPLGQTVIGLDTDGTPYIVRSGSSARPVGVGLDTDGTPFLIRFLDPEGL